MKKYWYWIYSTEKGDRDTGSSASLLYKKALKEKQYCEMMNKTNVVLIRDCRMA